MPHEAPSRAGLRSAIGGAESLRDAAEKAAFVLQSCQFVGELRGELTAVATTPDALWQYCADQAEFIARRLGGAESQLTEMGWTTPPYHPAMLPHHVFAVAAGLAIEAYTSASPPTDLLVCQRLADEAIFMLGRHDIAQRVEAKTRAKEAQTRSANAKKGGAPQRVSDADLISFHSAWMTKHGRDRGWKTAAQAHFEISSTGLQKRLKKLNL